MKKHPIWVDDSGEGTEKSQERWCHNIKDLWKMTRVVFWGEQVPEVVRGCHAIKSEVTSGYLRTFSVLILLHIEEYATVKAMAEGRLTYVFKKGMISAPELGAVTTRTSWIYQRCDRCYKRDKWYDLRGVSLTFVSRKIV